MHLLGHAANSACSRPLELHMSKFGRCVMKKKKKKQRLLQGTARVRLYYVDPSNFRSTVQLLTGMATMKEEEQQHQDEEEEEKDGGDGGFSGVTSSNPELKEDHVKSVSFDNVGIKFIPTVTCASNISDLGQAAEFQQDSKSAFRPWDAGAFVDLGKDCRALFRPWEKGVFSEVQIGSCTSSKSNKADACTLSRDKDSDGMPCQGDHKSAFRPWDEGAFSDVRKDCRALFRPWEKGVFSKIQIDASTSNKSNKEVTSTSSRDKDSNGMPRQGVDFGLTLVGGTEDLSITPDCVETIIWSDQDFASEETDSCCTEFDSEDSKATTEASRKHRKNAASESCGQEPQIPQITVQSTSAAALEGMLNWDLFCQNVGEVVYSVEIQSIAKELVELCGDNLDTIHLMSRALKRVPDIVIWKYTLENLRMQHTLNAGDVEPVLVSTLKFRIERLEDDLTRKCLRHFSQRCGNDGVGTASLIDGWIEDGLISTESEGKRVVHNLVDASLLELAENGEILKLQDLNRDILVDLLAESKGSCNFLMQGGLGLVEPPEVGEWERAKEIFLMQNDLSELPESPMCPSLSALYLQRNSKLRMVPSSFFTLMPALKVLNLSRTRIKSLPESLFQLVNLKRLFLNECALLRKLPPEVGELKSLEVLDLEGTKIIDLPPELQKLTNLICLEVSILGRSSTLSPLIPSGVISALSQLEELNIELSPESEWGNTCLEGLVEEICSLKRLTALKFSFPKMQLLRQFNSSHPSLSNFHLVIGSHASRIMSRLPADVEFELQQWSRYLKYTYGDRVSGDVKKLLRQANAFFLDRHTNLKTFSDFGVTMDQLKCCVIGECNDVQVLVDGADINGKDSSKKVESESGVAVTQLRSLEYLYVYYMKNLEAIWRGPLQKGSLSSLKSLTLRTCPKLTSVFTRGMLGSLCNLEELLVEDCASMATLVSSEVYAHLEPSYSLPKMKKMSLHYLPKLSSICSSLSIAPNIQWLSFYDCPSLKRLELSVKALRRIKCQQSWWDNLEWLGNRPDNVDDLFVSIIECEIP